MATDPPANGRTTPAPPQQQQQQNGETEPEVTNPTQPEAEAEVVLEGEELFMVVTPEEEEEWRKKMAQMESSLQTRRENFHQWHDGITRRRMFAYSRLRKLQEAGQKRTAFFDQIAAYISATKSKAQVTKNDNNNNNNNNSNNNNNNNNAQESQKTDQQKKTVSGTSPQGQQQQQQQQQKETVAEEKTVTVKPLLRS